MSPNLIRVWHLQKFLDLIMPVYKTNPCRNWCFTCWDLDNEPVEWLPEDCKYIYQLEHGDNEADKDEDQKRPHYQGYIEFAKVYTLKMMKKLHPTSNFTNRNGTRKMCYEYCTKEKGRMAEPVFNFSLSDKREGQRTDLDQARPLILEHAATGSWLTLMEDDRIDAVVSKYRQWTKDLFNSVRWKAIPLVDVVLRCWQQTLLDYLAGPPDPRIIIWIYDKGGNSGKSFMVNYLGTNHGAFTTKATAYDAFAYLYDKERIVCIDYSRETDLKFVSYRLLEDVKDGHIMSTKYQPVRKRFPSPHTICFANGEPNYEKLSADRLNRSVWNIDGELPPCFYNDERTSVSAEVKNEDYGNLKLADEPTASFAPGFLSPTIAPTNVFDSEFTDEEMDFFMKSSGI